MILEELRITWSWTGSGTLGDADLVRSDGRATVTTVLARGEPAKVSRNGFEGDVRSLLEGEPIEPLEPKHLFEHDTANLWGELITKLVTTIAGDELGTFLDRPGVDHRRIVFR